MSAKKAPTREAAKRKSTANNEDSNIKSHKAEKKVRPCSKTSCPATAPICFARSSQLCCGNGYTSRWYHITAGEHFCNECFEHFYRSYKDGYDIYMSWKRLWTQYGNTDHSIRSYMVDQVLPYWVECNLCHKWRSVFRETDISPKFLKSYVCTKVLKHQSQAEACEAPEDFRVEMTKEVYLWPIHISCNQYLKNSIYAPYVRDFVLDSVGISPSDTSVHKYPDGVFEVRPYMQPFQYDDPIALALPPDQLSDEELLYFPEFHGIYLRYYLIIRNTILVLWCLDVKSYVTLDRVMTYINLRGLSRIWLTLHVQRLLLFLTLKGYINSGVASLPKDVSFIQGLAEEQKHPVIIIGGGIAGLSAARQLTNLGVKVKVLEAGSQIGGRAVDRNSSFPTQSYLVVGCQNNPLVVMCKQLDIPIMELGDSCPLLTDSGEVIDDKTDRRMQFHFEAMLDINKQLCKDLEKDTSLMDRFTHLHTQFKDESGINFDKMEEHLLQFHMSNLEYACGSSLDAVSALHWDQNEDMPQFQGPPVMLQGDMKAVLDRLAEGIDVCNDCKVTGVDYSGKDILVSAGSEEFTASKVIVSVPLSILKAGSIQFTPALPDYKTSSLGIGHVEKVLLKFESPFWKDRVKTSNMFGCVQTGFSFRGMFDVFYDISNKEEYMLSTFISGKAIETLRQKSDKEVADMCVECLKNMFKDASFPTAFYVSRWYSTADIGMAYSFIPVNAGANAFNNMQEDVQEKIYFAGEATHSQFPQTLTGAYMSGVREAEKIYRALVDVT
ncbi:lysine-specific histone demethylase 2-like [Dreissena polymorpha]|uniref:Amine oxidase n=1 Tax=Dreissena polymorpha TaxID=45954 RepID=A0A9D4I596_DREPO|nr:lysine-specific histone demethylase 2-like [Dreissena polymorpha]XP_052234603.1 lysine-specific histone demethylase 2-like [Dreissena polymorpha]XP_052234604.1 lysine-specific histone demethylase 2-like [Dreissena polymorpha]KAH3748720.1 hypothetical protein DPMN_183170 [Dreissena polymorpha]